MFDLSYQIDAERIALCPLCDQPMSEWENTTTLAAEGYKCMAHYSCAIDKLNESEEEEDENN